MSDLPTTAKGVYRHNKSGRLYEVIGVATHTETDEILVVYRPLYESRHELFARPISMFTEEVSIDERRLPRFTKINENRG